MDILAYNTSRLQARCPPVSSHTVHRSLDSSWLGSWTATLLVWFEPVSMPPKAWAKKTPSGSTDRKPGQSCRTWPSGTDMCVQTVAPALNSQNIGNETFALILIQRPHFQRSDGGVDTRSGGCPSQIHRYIPHSLHSQSRWHEAHHTGHRCGCQNEGTF